MKDATEILLALGGVLFIAGGVIALAVISTVPQAPWGGWPIWEDIWLGLLIVGVACFLAAACCDPLLRRPR